MSTIQADLFKPDEAKRVIEPGKRCRNCIHLYDHQYGNMKYCDRQYQRGTSYGHKKIKANDPACHMFESNTEKLAKAKEEMKAFRQQQKENPDKLPF